MRDAILLILQLVPIDQLLDVIEATVPIHHDRQALLLLVYICDDHPISDLLLIPEETLSGLKLRRVLPVVSYRR